MSEEGRPIIRVVLVDDHTAVRESIRRSMEDEGFLVVGEARDGEEGVRVVVDTNPDVVLMDVSMPVLDGIDATRRVKDEAPDSSVVMLTMHADPEIVRNALRAGAVGYLVKDASIDEVLDAVRLAADGATALSRGLAVAMLEETGRSASSTGAEAAVSEHDGIISKREEEVLRLVAEGLSVPEIGEQLFISAKTVKNHLSSIYQKLEARDRVQAVLRAVRLGIIRLDTD